MERPWEAIAQPIKQAGLSELRKLKAQYKQFKEVKSRQTTDIQSVLEVFGLLAAKKGSPSGDDEGEQRDDSMIPMEVKFEEEPYEDEDWFLMLLSELIFDKLKLQKPQVQLNYVPLIEEEGEPLDIAQESQAAIEPDLKQLLNREETTDKRFPLIDQVLMPQTARKALLLLKLGLI